MCGIVGYVGKRNAQNVLLDGLEKLEYRGYDSAGVALALEGGIRVVKSKGRLAELRKKLELQACSVGGGRILVNKVDGIDVSFDGMFNTLVIRNQDENGAVAAVTSVLNQLRINVANMSLCRHKRGGDALMVIETDQHIKPHQVAFLSELTGILSVTYYDKEDDDDVAGFDEGNL